MLEACSANGSTSASTRLRRSLPRPVASRSASEREAPFVDRSHPVLEDRVHETRLRAEVVLRGRVVALAGLGPDLPQRDRADPAFGEQPLGGEEHLLPGARAHASDVKTIVLASQGSPAGAFHHRSRLPSTAWTPRPSCSANEVHCARRSNASGPTPRPCARDGRPPTWRPISSCASATRAVGPGSCSGGSFGRYTEKLMAREKAKGYPAVLARLRSGPPEVHARDDAGRERERELDPPRRRAPRQRRGAPCPRIPTSRPSSRG